MREEAERQLPPGLDYYRVEVLSSPLADAPCPRWDPADDGVPRPATAFATLGQLSSPALTSWTQLAVNAAVGRSRVVMPQLSPPELVALIAGQLVASRGDCSAQIISESVEAAVRIVDAAETAIAARHAPGR
jgi:hypothetical protein